MVIFNDICSLHEFCSNIGGGSLFIYLNNGWFLIKCHLLISVDFYRLYFYILCYFIFYFYRLYFFFHICIFLTRRPTQSPTRNPTRTQTRCPTRRFGIPNKASTNSSVPSTKSTKHMSYKFKISI